MTKDTLLKLMEKGDYNVKHMSSDSIEPYMELFDSLDPQDPVLITYGDDSTYFFRYKGEYSKFTPKTLSSRCHDTVFMTQELKITGNAQTVFGRVLEKSITTGPKNIVVVSLSEDQMKKESDILKLFEDLVETNFRASINKI